MANAEHLKILESGVEAWNRWRHYQPSTKPDLRRAHLKETNLSKANLREANLHGADLFATRLEGADLEGANLEGANIQGANLHRANLIGACLTRANLLQANLREAKLYRSTLEMANLYRAIMEKADLNKANLTGANLREANLHGADLFEADLSGADLIEATLHEANLFEAVLVWAKLIQADLRKAEMFEANLERANLFKADLRGANLERVNLGWANLKETNIEGINLVEVHLDPGADLLSAKWKSLEIDNRVYLRETVETGEEVLPYGMGTLLRFVFESRRLLTGDELAAARDLALAFGLISKGTELALNLAAAGERFTVTARCNYEQAANVGLAILRATQQAHPALKPLEDAVASIERKLDENLSQNLIMQHRTQKQISDLKKFIETQIPHSIEFPNKETAEDFRLAATKASLNVDDMKIEGRIVRFGKRVLQSPETPAILGGLLAEYAGIAGSFSFGYAGTKLLVNAFKKNTEESAS